MDPAAQADAEMAYFELPLEEPSPCATDSADLLDLDLLYQNAAWFCRLRWIVVAILGAASCAAAFGAPLERLGLRLSPTWPLAAAGVLAALNWVYLVWLPRGTSRQNALRLQLHLWLQIVVDLVVLTVAIHYLGSVETPAPFMYLFHIILACIFFSPLRSLLVVLTAAALYLACLTIETFGGLKATSLLIHHGLADRSELGGGFWLAHLGFTFLIWLVIWWLASRLAGALRQRDRNLADANARLRRSSEERARHMLQTTHQLKAPFAAIHANAQLLLKGACGPLPDAAREVVGRIAARCAMLSQQVLDMLQLANLRSASQTPAARLDLDLAAVIQASIARFEATAGQRNIRLVAQLEPVKIQAVEDHWKMLIDNLLTNAIHYSHDGGTVQIAARRRVDGAVEVSVCDEGIGIEAEKLPRIFDDYYRTNAAARHNKDSTGLGLAIVRHVTRTAGIRVRVESRHGRGTRFVLRVDEPAETSAPHGGSKPAAP